ncbi:MAG TPA: dTDP-4-amino-4,6-dideoxygalactose transaminase [Mycobacteriales bacterium]|jgi:dTDP-4-amino-4,6-dideoxygalactose transaminase
MPEGLIPFNVPYVAGADLAYAEEAMRSGHLHGDGPFTRRATGALKELTGAPHALLTTSCTHALEMAALLLDLGPGDEVLVPSFTFVSTASAVAMRGATPVFVDVRPDTLNVEVEAMAAAVTPRTRAAFVVHYGGIGCDLDALDKLCADQGLTLVEDNAHGLGGSRDGRTLGTVGSLATQSFHDTKNIQCGEGGALLINDTALAERAEILREKGTNRSRFIRGQVDKYTWVDLGSSYLPSDVLAAFLLGQLEGFDAIQARRLAVWDTYHAELAAWAAENGVATPVVPDGAVQPAHLYFLLLPDHDEQQRFLAHLREQGVAGVFHYLPLHESPAGQQFGRTGPGGCPVTEDVAYRLVRLPLFAGMTGEQVSRVVEAVTAYRTGRG